MEFVKIETGEIQGREFEHGCVFLGIPYAAAPVGDLRWAPPAPADSWNGVLDCTHPKNRCYQAFPPEAQRVDTSVPVEERTTVDYVREFHSSPAFPDAPESEDALTLNIWTPAKTSEDGLSVAVWIHGGAFVNGSGLEMEFDGVEYAKRGVILVTVNYRLGLMGFFSHPDLRRETEKYGNYGLQDQLAALNWVKRNIRVFGGDPDKVTLFGQSAGCVSTMYQLCAGESRGLFHQVILQSGGGYNSHFVDLSVKADFAAQAGLEFGKRYFNTEKIEDLRRVSASELRSCLLQEQKRSRDLLPLSCRRSAAACFQGHPMTQLHQAPLQSCRLLSAVRPRICRRRRCERAPQIGQFKWKSWARHRPMFTNSAISLWAIGSAPFTPVSFGICLAPLTAAGGQWKPVIMSCVRKCWIDGALLSVREVPIQQTCRSGRPIHHPHRRQCTFADVRVYKI